MANLYNMIVADVARMQKYKLQITTQKLEKSQKENETLKRQNKTLKLVIKQLTTHLDEKNKLLVTKDEKAQLQRRELQDCEAGKVHVERQQAEFNTFNGLDSVSICNFVFSIIIENNKFLSSIAKFAIRPSRGVFSRYCSISK